MSAPLRQSGGYAAPLATQVAKAKYLMRDHGMSMAEAARALDVMPNELDLALWGFIGIAPEDLSLDKPRPEPMF